MGLITLLLLGSLPFIFFFLFSFLPFLVCTFSFCIKQARIILWGCLRGAIPCLFIVTIIFLISSVLASLFQLWHTLFFSNHYFSWRWITLFQPIQWLPRHILFRNGIFSLHTLFCALCLLSLVASWPFCPRFWLYWYCLILIGI